MSTHQIHVFISHSWAHSHHYDTLADWISNKNWTKGQASLNFRDYSVPRNDPIHNANTEQKLREAIYAKIGLSHVVIIPTGMYAEYSNWIQKEIDGAKYYGKPIIAVNPWGQQRKSTVVMNNATASVGWNGSSLVSKIWELYRA